MLDPGSLIYIPDDCRVSEQTQLPQTNVTKQYQTICAFGCLFWALSFSLALANTNHSCEMLSKRLGVVVYLGLFGLFIA